MNAIADIVEVWRIAVPFLQAEYCDEPQWSACDWTAVCAKLATIPESATLAFLAPQAFETVGDFRVIAYRAQNAVLVAIPLANIDEPDPPVWIADNLQSLTWHAEFEHFSDWAASVLLWCLVNDGRGVLGFAGRGGIGAGKRLKADTCLVASESRRIGIRFCRVQPKVLLAFAGKSVYAWAENQQAWQWLATASRLKWDYCSLDDAASES